MTKATEPLNPKDVAALDRVPLHLVPALGEIHAAQACRDGALKGYGPYNWRENPISLMGYIGAIKRHCASILDGEDVAADSGVTHLGCIAANAAIMLDAGACGTLIDDRPTKPGGSPKELQRFREEKERERASATTKS